VAAGCPRFGSESLGCPVLPTQVSVQSVKAGPASETQLAKWRRRCGRDPAPAGASGELQIPTSSCCTPAPAASLPVSLGQASAGRSPGAAPIPQPGCRLCRPSAPANVPGGCGRDPPRLAPRPPPASAHGSLTPELKPTVLPSRRIRGEEKCFRNTRQSVQQPG